MNPKDWEGHTPGPWAWFGNQHDLYLATPDRGRLYVMGFRRMGFNGAQPVFRGNRHMVKASELVRFEVGDGTARGFSEAKSDGSVYRYDVRGIDHPDAALIAAAPELAAEVERLRGALRPFDDAAKDRVADDPAWRDHDTVQIVITIGDLRRVAAAIRGEDA